MKLVAIYERDVEDPRYWNVRVDGHEGCVSFAFTLREAREMIADAATVYFGRDIASGDLEHDYRVPGISKRALAKLIKVTETQERAAQERATLLSNIVRKLKDTGVSTRDSAQILGLTAARVSQIARGVR